MEKSFSERVWEAAKHVPKGRVTTYKEIAHALGCRAYRAVGNALNRNPYAPIVPCHRIVGSDGSLAGFAQGLKKKEMLLKSEGVAIEKGKVKNFKKVFCRLKKSHQSI